MIIVTAPRSLTLRVLLHVLSNVCCSLVLVPALFVLTMLLVPLLRPWAGRIAALLSGAQVGQPNPYYFVPGLWIAIALAIQPASLMVSYLVMRLSHRLGYPARFAPPAALVWSAVVYWQLAQQWPSMRQTPSPPWMDLQSQGGLELVCLSALCAIPAVSALAWTIGRTSDCRARLATSARCSKAGVPE